MFYTDGSQIQNTGARALFWKLQHLESKKVQEIRQQILKTNPKFD